MPTQILRILIVEDDDDVLGLFSAVLIAMGYVLETAHSASQALTCASHFKPSAVFTSIGLSGQCGFEFCAKLRSLPVAENALIVAVTGYGLSSHQRSTQNCFDHYLVKPVPLDEMLRTMELLEGYRGTLIPPIHLPPPKITKRS